MSDEADITETMAARESGSGSSVMGHKIQCLMLNNAEIRASKGLKCVILTYRQLRYQLTQVNLHYLKR